MRIQKYRDLPYLNQSWIKAIISGSIGKSDYESSGFSTGSLVDCILTTPDLFDTLYHISSVKLGEKPQLIVNYLAEQGINSIDIPEIVDVMNMFNYRMNYKEGDDPRRLDKLREDCEDYFMELEIAGNRKMVTQEDVDHAYFIANSIKEGRFTSSWWYLPYGLEIYTQVVITFEVEGIMCKAMLDKIIVNPTDRDIHIGNYLCKAKTVIPIDYKTTAFKTERFEREMRKYGYHIQGSFYRTGLGIWCKKNRPELTVDSFFFIVESTKNPGKPLIYKLSAFDEALGEWGGLYKEGKVELSITNDTQDSCKTNLTLDILGWQQGITLYKWHELNDEWEYTKRVIDSNGLIETNLYR